jgi:hypothetical protein
MSNRHFKVFLNNARAKFGEKFNYRLVDYINQSTKVLIVCPIHGEFSITPASHLGSATGCKSCGLEKLEKHSRSRTKSTTEFIQEAQEKHKGRYDYSKTRYVGKDIKLTITCSKHGDFDMRPNNHLTKGQGCPDCSGNRKLSKREFVRRAKEIHGDEYDYSQLQYRNMISTVVVICPKHGVFSIWARMHIEGKGTKCPECTNECLSQNYRMTTEEFIKKAKEVHRDRFD